MTDIQLSYLEQLLIQRLEEHNEINTFTLREIGLCSPNTVVFTLRAKGINIITNRKPVMDYAGVLHKRVAHYSLGGNDE